MRESRTVAEVIEKIQTLFSDDNLGIVFSSVHRAKGLEASCANLYDLVVSKSFTLRAMYDKQR